MFALNVFYLEDLQHTVKPQRKNFVSFFPQINEDVSFTQPPLMKIVPAYLQLSVMSYPRILRVMS